MGILIRNALVDGRKRDIRIEGERILRVIDSGGSGDGGTARHEGDRELSGAAAADVIEADGFAALPSLVNAHAHSPMTLLRGIAEDQELMPWLTREIWPREAKLTSDDIYWGYRLAALEMIRSGTTVCNEMYFDPEALGRAARDAGIRSIIAYPLMDGMDAAAAETQRRDCRAFFDSLPDFGSRVVFGTAAHSVYMTSAESLRWLGEFAKERDLFLHVHVSETENENRDCEAAHGVTPTRYLADLGVLGPKTVAAHCVWCSAEDFGLLAASGAAVAHNPVSNMKLASGAFDYALAGSKGVTVLLGTDGAASNNSLDLFSDMKIAGLLQKLHFRDPTRFPVAEILEAASAAGHAFFRTGGGAIREGAAADLILVDLRDAAMTPVHDLPSNLVYAASSSAVNTTICAGRILMRNRKIEGEDEVIAEAARRAAALAST